MSKRKHNFGILYSAQNIRYLLELLKDILSTQVAVF